MLKDSDIYFVIEDIAKFITNKKIVYSSDKVRFYQTTDKIVIDKLNKGENYMLLHEVGHFLAATEEERKIENLGLPTDLMINDWVVEKEIKAREFTKALFLPWAMNTLDQNSTQFKYIEYLCTAIFSLQEKQEYLISDDFINQTLKNLNLSIEKIHNRLQSKTSEIIYNA